jgi:hypothetical protein
MNPNHKRYYNEHGALIKEEYFNKYDSVVYTFKYNYRNNYLNSIVEEDTTGPVFSTFFFRLGSSIDVVSNEKVVDMKNGRLVCNSTYEYDCDLNLIKELHVDSSGELDYCCSIGRYSYDVNDNLIYKEQTQYDKGLLKVYYTYDSIGKLTDEMEVIEYLTVPLLSYYGQVAADTTFTHYVYNSTRQVSERRLTDKYDRVHTHVYTYFPSGQLRDETLTGPDSRFRTIWTYDKYGNGLSMVNEQTEVHRSEIVMEYNYRYDQHGNWVMCISKDGWVELRNIEYYE